MSRLGEREQMQIEGYSLATFQAASAALLCLERDSLRKDRQADSVTQTSAANQPSLATSPALTSPPQPSAPSSSQPTTETSPTSSSTVDSAESQQQHGGAAHRPKRMSWINAVLAKQAAITHEVQQTTSQEEEGEEGEEGEEWTLFTTAPATNIDHHSSDNELDEGEQVHEEDLLKDDAQGFMDTFHAPTPTSPARPSQPSTTSHLLIDWGDTDSTSAPNRTETSSSSSSSSSSTEA